MAILLNEQGGAPLMDADMTATFRRGLNLVWGIVFAVVALAIALSLWSYNIGDPSLFSATTQPPMNLLGSGGAIISDALIRYTGLGAWALVLFFGVWAIRFMFGLGEMRIWARLVLALPALAFAPVFASLHAVYDGWPLSGSGLGGTLGDTGARMLLDVVPLADTAALPVLSLILGLALLLVGGAALGFNLREAGRILGWLWRSLRLAVGKSTHWVWTAGRKGTKAAVEKARELRMKPRSETMEPAEPTGSWRMKLPEVAAVGMPKLADVQLPKFGRVEPEFPFDRIGGGEHPPVEPETASVGRVVQRSLTATDGADVKEDAARSGFSLRTVFDRLSEAGDMPIPSSDASDPPTAAELRQNVQTAEPTRPAVERETRKPRKSRQAEAERQPSLMLGDEGDTEFHLPPLALLGKPVSVARSHTSDIALEENARMLETVLEDYGVRGEIVRPPGQTNTAVHDGCGGYDCT